LKPIYLTYSVSKRGACAAESCELFPIYLMTNVKAKSGKAEYQESMVFQDTAGKSYLANSLKTY